MLKAQVDRMLADEKAEAFVRNFAGQWLGLRKVGPIARRPNSIPQYDRHLEISIVRESEAYFREFLANDLDARRMIRSDFVVINERLARFYGIPDVRGDDFRRVKVPEGVHRGGLVTQASTLLDDLQWHEDLAGEAGRGSQDAPGVPPGLPVANVGEIAPKVPGIDKATVRQRLEVHRTCRAFADATARSTRSDSRSRTTTPPGNGASRKASAPGGRSKHGTRGSTRPPPCPTGRRSKGLTDCSGPSWQSRACSFLAWRRN